MRVVAFVSIAVALAGCGGRSVVVEVPDELPLAIGGSSSNFGSVRLDTGFMPDPHTVAIVSGASVTDAVDVAGIGLVPRNHAPCRGHVTSRPDYIVHVGAPGPRLRIYVEAPGDTTLVVNDGEGNWWCSDDEGGELNPAIYIPSPPSGQYDIWVGSYQAGANIRSALHVSELDGR